MANLRLFNVNKVYDGGVHAVKDFCLDVNDKEFVIFVGPSGCGKSTVLRMIAGLEKISSGDCYIGDKLVNALPSKERNIAMVFQNYALFPNMSVYDNISYGLRMQGVDKAIIEEKVQEAAKMLNLSDHLNRKPSQLSGGQRQRVALGRAIVRDPDVFLLDEPLSNLDAKLRNKMRKEIMSLHRRLDATFIYVTHDQTEAMTMGDKIVVMRDGVIQQVGTPTLLYRHPDNVFVAGFIGTPQMNFWQGSIRCQDGALSVQCPWGTFPLTEKLALRLEDSAKVEGKKIIVGLRPEDLTVERNSADDVEMTAKIRVVEDFCSYGIFHAETNGVEVVGQDNVGLDWLGKETKLYANIRNVHIFDAETERSLLPQYAASQTVSGVKEGRKLRILGATCDLPEQAQELEDGPVQVRIPANAVIEGDTTAVCEEVLDTKDGPVTLLQVDGVKLYAKGDFTGKEGIGFDVSRLELDGNMHISAVPESFTLQFTYEKCNGVDQGRKVQKHFCVFGDTKMESYYEFNKKMYRMGRKVFREQLRMYLTTENLRPAVENECYPCLQGTVMQVIDYGDKQFAQVAVGEQMVYVPGALNVGKQATLAVDLDHVHVGIDRKDTIFF